MNLASLPYAQIMDVAQNGSPALLKVAGRAFGLGAEERQALSKGSIPGWFWGISGVALGVFAGVRLYKGAGDKLPTWLKGK